MPKPRFFVALDEQGNPLSQRTSTRARPYVAANFDGYSFSSTGPNGSYPRKVVEVPRGVEWVSRATLKDGTPVIGRSSSRKVGQNFVRYSFVANGYNVRTSGAEPNWRTSETWTDEPSAENWLARQGTARPGVNQLDYRVEAFAIGSREIKHWPAAGDSMAIPSVGEGAA